MKYLVSTILLVIMAISSALAAPLKNVPCTITQPNGEVIHCFVSGDEFFNYYHDADGYTIIMNPETGYYTYGVEVDGRVEPSEFIVGQVNPTTETALVPGARISDDIIMARRLQREREIRDHNPGIPNRPTMNHGLMTNLVVFISLSGDTVFPKTYSQVDNMFNDTSSSSSVSLKNYYEHVSYNQFSIQSYLFPQAGTNDVILSYHDSHPRNYYMPYSSTNPIGYTDADGRREREFTLLDSAIRYVKDMIPLDLDLDYNGDGNVDNVVFIVNTGVAGWSELLWPHRWSIYGRSVYMHGKRVYDYNLILAKDDYYFDIGTMCHEMFHSLSAPDLYSSSGNATYNGNWDLMEGTTNPPQNMMAYMKYKYGHWIEDIPEADSTGWYTIYPVATSPNCAYRIYPDRFNHPNQFVVIEYRNTSTPFDGTVYGTGAVIYRINTDFNGNHSTDYSVGSYPEVYTFRRGGFPGANPYTVPEVGNLNQSYFGTFNMSEFSEYTNPAPFYTNNTAIRGFRIVNITNYGDSLQFYLVKGEITIDTFPWVESFESPIIPYYCHHEFTNNYNVWKTQEGDHSGAIPSAHSGNSNAIFYNIINGSTKLVMPTFDFTFLNNPVVSFWYGHGGGSSYTLKVYYRSSQSEDWNLLQTYNTFTGQWTHETLSLPNPSATYQIAFEATGSNGTGLVLDDIVVSGDIVSGLTILATAGANGQISPSGSVTVTPHGNQTFTLIPDQGYTVDGLVVDGINQQRALIYTFEDVVSEHTISASFRSANPSLSVNPSALYYSTPGGETSNAKTFSVIFEDFVNTDDITIQSEEPFYVSTDDINYDLQTIVPYNGGMVYVVFAPPFGGTYNKTITVSNQTYNATVTLRGTSTGIEEQHGEAIQLYPNPAGDVLNLVFGNNELPKNVDIVDVYGRIVTSVKLVDDTNAINISNLQAGVYFIKADNIVKKFVKK